MYLQLFLCFAQIGLFSIGGGYAAIPLIQSQTVERYAWLSLQEFTDLVTIAEMTPGPIGVNAATFVGMRLLGVPGALLATAGVILPACIIVSLLSILYERFRGARTFDAVLGTIRPCVVALILMAGLKMLSVTASAGPDGSADWMGLGIFALVFVLLRMKKLQPIAAIVSGGALYLAGSWLLGLL